MLISLPSCGVGDIIPRVGCGVCIGVGECVAGAVKLGRVVIDGWVRVGCSIEDGRVGIARVGDGVAPSLCAGVVA